MEYVNGGSLSDVLDTAVWVPEKQLARIVKKLLECLEYFHNKNRFLGSIGPSQILFTKSGSIRLGPCLSQRLETDEISAQHDVYSLGMLVLTSLTSDYEILETMTCCVFHSIPDNPVVNRLSSQVSSFLCKALQKDPRFRPSAQELLKHEWLAMVDYSGPLVEIQDLININKTAGNGEYWEAADKQLDRLCEALKVVILGRDRAKPSDEAIQSLAEELEIRKILILERINKIYEEL